MKIIILCFLFTLCACRGGIVIDSDARIEAIEPSVEPGAEDTGEEPSQQGTDEASSSEEGEGNTQQEPSSEPSSEPSDSSLPEEESPDSTSGQSSTPGCDFEVFCFSFVDAQFLNNEEMACDQINDQYQAENPGMPLGNYVDGGCPEQSFGYCQVPDPEYHVYFYYPYPPSDAEEWCISIGWEFFYL